MTLASLQNIDKTEHLLKFSIVVVVAHLGKLDFIDFLGLKHVYALLSEISDFLFEIKNPAALLLYG